MQTMLFSSVAGKCFGSPQWISKLSCILETTGCCTGCDGLSCLAALPVEGCSSDATGSEFTCLFHSRLSFILVS